jgi:hypothetical protein
MLKIGLKRCPYCGDDEVYRSRREPLTWLDRVCGLFLLRLVRCRCQLRHYRPVFFPAPEYPSQISARVTSTLGHANDEKRNAQRSRVESQ